MAEGGDGEIAMGNDLESLAVQFGQSLMESDWKQYNDVPAEDASDPEVPFDDNGTFSQSEECSKESFPDDSEKQSVEGHHEILDDTDDKNINEGTEEDSKVNEKDSLEKKFTCKDCGLSYSKSSSFSNHRLAHHPSICPHCGRRFSMKSSLESHLQLECGLIIKTSTNSFECHICKKILSSKKILSRHLRRHTGVGKFTCRYCTKIFTQKINLDSHMQTHEKIKPFQCKQCGMSFSERSTVVRHVKRQHHILDDYSSYIESTLKPASQVDLANKFTVHGFDLFSRNKNGQSIKTEDETQSGLNKIENMTSLKTLLEKPLPSNKVDDNLQDFYQDKVEFKQENEAAGEYENVETELDEELEENDTTDTSFLNDSLQSGQKRTYSCKLCDKVYNHSSSLAKHMKGHSNAHNLICQICQTQFNMKRELITHMTLHYGGKRHCCPLCDVKFAGRSSILRHLRRSHKYSHEGARECLRAQEQESEVDSNIDYENLSELANENGSEDGSEFNMNDDKHLKSNTMNSSNEHDESENSLDVTVLTPNKAEEIIHYTCSLCQQIFLEMSEWKTHLCLLHQLTPDEADERIKLEADADFEPSLNFNDNGSMTNYGLDNKYENDGMGEMSFEIEKDDNYQGSLFDGALNVTLEKDENGIQKVVKVMPEVSNSALYKPSKELHGNKPFCCDICGTRFVEKSSVRRHLKRTHKFTPDEAREYMVQATYTRDPFKSYANEVKAEVSDSNETTEVANSSNPIEDEEELLKQNEALNQSYACKVCKKTFMLRSSVRRHLRKIHHFTHDESRSTVIPAEIMSEKRLQFSRASGALDDTAMESGTIEMTCKFCEETFTKPYLLRSHLMATHNFTLEKAKEILDEEEEEEDDDDDDDDDTESIGSDHKCGLCHVIFKKISSLKFHLMKLHRLSDIVAERILVGEKRKDYTEGLEDEVDTPSSSEKNNKHLDYKSIVDEQSDNVDEDDDEGDDLESLQDNSDGGTGTKNNQSTKIVDEEVLLSEINFNAVNPWGTDTKTESNKIDDSLVSSQEEDFMITKDEKIMDSNDELVKSGLNKSKNEMHKSLEKGNNAGYSFPRVYDCPICGKIMSDASARAKHIRRHEGMTGFKCQICERVFRQVRLIESHLKTHNGVGLKCGVCFIYCAERHSAKRHLRRIHSIEPNTAFSEKCIQQCTKDIPEGVLDASNHYTVLNLANEKDIDALVTNTNIKIEANESLESFGIQFDTDKIPNKILTDTTENDENENIFSNYLVSQSANDNIEIETYNETRIGEINKVNNEGEISDGNLTKGNKKMFKIDSVINNLHKKLHQKEPEIGVQSDMEGKKESETQSIYSATNYSPLKFKFTKKIKSDEIHSDSSFARSPFKVSNLLRKRSHNDSLTTEDEAAMELKKAKYEARSEKYIDIGESTGYEGSDNDDDNDSDSDKTVDFDYDEKKLIPQEKIGSVDVKSMIMDSGPSKKGDFDQSVAMLDQELLRAFMPQLADNSQMLDSLSKNNIVKTEIMEQSSTCETDSEVKKPKPVKHLECWECNKKYSNYKSYREHRRKKHPLSCNICRQVFVDVILYQSHMEAHAMGAKVAKNHDCPVCGKEFKDASSRAKHIRLHTGEKPYRCEVCGKRFTQTGHLQSHMRIHNGEKPFDCKLCGKYFTEKSSVKRHLRKMHFNQYNKKCEICGIISKTREEHREHLVTHKLKVYSCHVCSKDFIDSRALKVHTFNAHSQISHSISLREYRCNECDKQFFSTKGLKNHIRRHKNPLPTYKCGLCKKQFMHLSILKNHMNTHATNKEYVCEECGKCFGNSGYLTVHKKYHIIEKLNQIAELKKGKNKVDKERNLEKIINAAGVGDMNRSEKGIPDSVSSVDIKEEHNENIRNGELVEENNLDVLQQDSNSVRTHKKACDEIYIKTEPEDENNETIGNVEVNMNVNEDIDIESIQNSFDNTMVKIQKFTYFSCYYFFKTKEQKDVKENKVSLGDKTVITLDTDKTNIKWMDDGKSKSRCLTVYRCNQCQVYQLTKKNMMRHHDSVHHARKFQCTICPSQFSSKVMLQLHVKRSHGTSEVFKCPQCPKTFTERYSLRRHEKRHSGELPYECQTCHKRFISRYTLLFHMESHSSRRLQCKKCGTKFVHQRSYDNHQRAMCVGNRKRVAFRKMQHPPTSMQIQPRYLVCKYCSMAYNHTKSIEDHVRHVHPEHAGEISKAYTMDKNQLTETQGCVNVETMMGLVNNIIYNKDGDNFEMADNGTSKTETVENSIGETRTMEEPASYSNELAAAEDKDDCGETHYDNETVQVKVEQESEGYGGMDVDMYKNTGEVPDEG